MSEQKFIKVDGQQVPVTEEVYRVYYKMERRERYLEERDTTHGKVLYSNMDTEEMTGEEAIPDLDTQSVHDEVERNILCEKLRSCMDELSESEYELICALYFEGKTQTQLQKETGVLQQTISYREKQILKKLKKLIETKNNFCRPPHFFGLVVRGLETSPGKPPKN